MLLPPGDSRSDREAPAANIAKLNRAEVDQAHPKPTEASYERIFDDYRFGPCPCPTRPELLQYVRGEIVWWVQLFYGFMMQRYLGRSRVGSQMSNHEEGCRRDHRVGI